MAQIPHVGQKFRYVGAGGWTVCLPGEIARVHKVNHKGGCIMSGPRGDTSVLLWFPLGDEAPLFKPIVEDPTRDPDLDR